MKIDSSNMQEMTIAGKVLSDTNPVFLIAEAGVNHNGDINIAKSMVDNACKARVDAIKFQTFRVSDLILEHVEKAPYQKTTTGSSQLQSQMLEKLQIDEQFHKEVIRYCEEKGVIFLSTPYDEASLDLLLKLNVPAIKIAATDATNLLFLEKVAKCQKPVILSTGMCFMSEIEAAYSCLRENGCREIALLKCTSNYPTSINEVNLKGINSLRNSYSAVIGFSDHTPGIGASPYAVVMGARIIEKHFTLDKTMEGPDHKASLSLEELIQWVHEIRRVEEMMGGREIIPTKSEKENRLFMQKNLVARINMKPGTIITRNNIVAKRTGGAGIPAIKGLDLIGAKTTCEIKKDDIIKWSYISE